MGEVAAPRHVRRMGFRGALQTRVDPERSEPVGSPRAVNLIIEGVSMLANERAEIGALLDAEGGDLGGLIAALRARA